MIVREDILSLEFLKKSEYTGSSGSIRYRLEAIQAEGAKRLRAIVWPEPFSFAATPEDKKLSEEFPFSEEGIAEAVEWMNASQTAGKK